MARLLALALGLAGARAEYTVADFQELSNQEYYQFIDYNAIYGPGNGYLCYKVIIGVALLAVQDSCDFNCCTRVSKGGAGGYQGAVNVFANWDAIDPATGLYSFHNYQSDVGPGPYVVSKLDGYAMNDGTETGGVAQRSTCNCDGRVSPPCPCGAEINKPVNWGTGEYDIFPCPLVDPVTNPGRTCDPATCFAAGGNTGGKYPGEIWGCNSCDTKARVTYVFFQEGTSLAQPELEVYHTVQRWEALATNNGVSRTVTGDNYQACYYLAMVTLLDSPPPPAPVVIARKDPHLHFAHGGKADLRGEDGSVFNFLSARNVSWNVKTEAADFKWAHRVVHGTRLSSVYWTVRTDADHIVQIEYDAATPDRATVRNLNETEKGSSTDHILKPAAGGSTYGTTYWLDNLFVKLVGRVLTVTVQDKWRMSVKQSPFPFAKLNLKKSLLDISAEALYDADHDVVAPHGLFGQSYDGDKIAVDGKIDTRSGDETTTAAQAEGAIEGVYTDYKVDPKDPFSTAFKYSRFDAVAAKPRDVSKLTGIKHASTTEKGAAVSSTDVPTELQQ